ncbi:MAG: hypothetical protein H0X24_06455 [Ktedonobacterales bacterium]|nr:hypothetical protein [Ktedonobacterales bacterium]
MSNQPPPYGNPPDPQQGGYSQNPQQGGYSQNPQQGGYPPNPQQGDYRQYPQQPASYPQYPQQPQTGGYPPPQQPGGYPPYPQQGGYNPYPPAPQLQPVTPKRNPLGLILGVVAALLIVAVVAGSLIYTTRKSSQDQVTAYTAAKPGLNCDKGDGKWQALDSKATGICQSNGFLFTRTSDKSTVAELYFLGKNGAGFADSYRAAVDATIVSGDTEAGVGLNVHVQKDGGDGQIVIARANGDWIAESAPTSGTSTKLAEGFAPATKTWHLEVLVQGAVLTFSINNQVVTTVTDATFTKTTAIGLVLSDPTQAGVSANLSNFAYTPQPNSTLSFADAAATATVTTQELRTKPYSAAIPGPQCDKGNGAWAAPAVFGDTDTTIKCASTGLAVTQPANTPHFGFVSFYGPQGLITNDYSLSVQMDLSKNTGGCGSIASRGSDSTGGFLLFALCSDGSYVIARSEGADGLTQLKEGVGTAKAVQTVKVITKGSTHTFAVGGKTVATITDSTVAKTDFVGLVSFNLNDKATTSATTTFKNFVYAPSN